MFDLTDHTCRVSIQLQRFHDLSAQDIVNMGNCRFKPTHWHWTSRCRCSHSSLLRRWLGMMRGILPLLLDLCRCLHKTVVLQNLDIIACCFRLCSLLAGSNSGLAGSTECLSVSQNVFHCFTIQCQRMCGWYCFVALSKRETRKAAL